MSLILDALNRADRERSEPALSLQPETTATPIDAGNTHTEGKLLIILIALVAAALIVFSVKYFRAPVPVPHTSAAADSALPSTASISPEATNRASLAPANVDTTQSTDVPEDPAPVTRPKAVPDVTANLTPAPVDKPVSRDEQASTIAGLYAARDSLDSGVDTGQATSPQHNSPGPSQTVNSAPATTPAKPSPPAAKTPPDRNTILQGIPLLAAMSPRLQQQIPSIDYSVHVYNEDDGSGAVKLNGQLCRIGTILAPGLRVIAILPDSVVLDLNGTQFRLAALNSWVNFQ